MIFCYMDEAGNTGEKIDDPTQPFHYVAGLLVEEKNWKAIPLAMRKIAVDVLGENVVSQPGFKFHGSCLFAGNAPWRGIAKADRIAILKSCLVLIEKNDCRLVYGRCDKVKLQRYVYPMHPHGVAVWLCYERAAKFANDKVSLLSLVAASGTRALSKVAEDVLADYRKKGAPFGRTISLENVVDGVQFIPTANSFHLQLCDLWLWTTHRYFTHKPLEPDIEQLYKLFRNQFFDRGTFPY